MPEVAAPAPVVRRRLNLWWSLLACLLIVCAAVSYMVLRAAMVLYTYPERPAPLPIRLYYRLFGSEIQRQDMQFDGSDGPIALRVYTPVGRAHAVPIVLAHGFAPLGNGDQHLDLLGRSLARAGFIAIIPTLPQASHFHMSFSDVAVLHETIRWAIAEYRQKVAVLGISFGGGLIVPAAAQPDVVDHIKVIAILSGYNDLDRVGHYYIHLPAVGPDGEPYPDHAPNIGRVVIAAYLPEMLEPADARALAAPLEKIGSNPWFPLPPGDPSLQGLDPHELALFNDMQVIRTEEMRRRFLGILERHRAEFASISPSSVLDKVHAPIYILHGEHDEIFPPGEAFWTKRQAVHSHTTVLITPALAHVASWGPQHLWDRLRVGFFFARILWVMGR